MHVHAKQALVQEQQQDGRHLHGGLPLAEPGDVDDAGGVRQPFAQGADDDFAADDDSRQQRGRMTRLHQQRQRRGDQQLVRDRVEETAKGGDLVAAAGQVAVQPVRGRGQREERRRAQVPGPAGQVEHESEQRYQEHARGRELVGDGPVHAPLLWADARHPAKPFFGRSGWGLDGTWRAAGAQVSAPETGTWHGLTTKAGQALWRVRFQPGDVLVLGPETRGLPAEALADLNPVRIPMRADAPVRSLNLSSAAAIAVYEALRQLGDAAELT